MSGIERCRGQEVGKILSHTLFSQVPPIKNSPEFYEFAYSEGNIRPASLAE